MIQGGLANSSSIISLVKLKKQKQTRSSLWIFGMQKEKLCYCFQCWDPGQDSRLVEWGLLWRKAHEFKRWLFNENIILPLDVFLIVTVKQENETFQQCNNREYTWRAVWAQRPGHNKRDSLRRCSKPEFCMVKSLFVVATASTVGATVMSHRETVDY